MTLSVEKLPSLDPPELTKGVTGEETTAINASEITTSACNVAAASELATAEEASSEHDGTVPMKKRTYMDLRELTAGVDEDDATVIAALGITSSSCNFTVASELATAEEAYSEHDGTVPMKKRTYMDLRELTAGVDEDDATVISAIGITSSSCNFTVASELATAEEAYSEHDGTVPMKKRTYMDLRELTAGVDEDDATVIAATGITSSSCNLTVASELATAEEKLSGINITLPLEKCSVLDVHESSEVLRKDKSTNVYESEITTSSHNVITGRELFISADEYFEGNISLPVDKVSLVDEAVHAEVIATNGTTSKDEIEIAASLNDVSVVPQGFFGDDGSAEDVTLPVEKVSSLDVLKSADAIATDETLVTGESEVTSSIHGDSAVVGEKPSEAYVTLPVEKLYLLEVHHGPVEVMATGETANLDEVEITACAYDGSVITAEKGLSEDTTLPVEDITSPEVHQPTMSVTTDEITSLEGNKIAESICDVALAVQRHFQDKTALPGEKVSSLDVHEPANALPTNETTTPDDSKFNAHNYGLNATCKHLMTPLVMLGVCWFHCDTCMGSFLFSCLYSRVSLSF